MFVLAIHVFRESNSVRSYSFLLLSASLPSIDIMIRIHIPNIMQGRIWSLVSLYVMSGMAVAYGIGGLLADYVSILY